MMLPRVQIGSRGKGVSDLQQALNCRGPSALPPLKADGIFGPKTLARVKEFQGERGLTPDGVVGAKTWAEITGEGQAGAGGTVDCGVGDPGNKGLATALVGDFLQVKASFVPASAGGAALGFTPKPPSGPLRMLDPSQRAIATGVYGASLDFSRIFISNRSGLGGRPFTFAFPDGSQVVQIMCCGTFSPSTATLIHELAHAWQSQHHSDPYRYIGNAVDSQAEAVVANGHAALSDPVVLLHVEFPVHWPFSAYAYHPSLPFEHLAAEQMAQAAHKGHAPVRAHMKAAPMNVVDTGNLKALAKTRTGDRRLKGMVI